MKGAGTRATDTVSLEGASSFGFKFRIDIVEGNRVEIAVSKDSDV